MLLHFLKKAGFVVSAIGVLFVMATSGVVAQTAPPATSDAGEYIKIFNSELTINQDTSLSIIETIEFVTNKQKHGIYRYIPVRYNYDGVQKQLAITEVSVTNPAGEPLPFSQSYEKNNLTLKIGDPDATFTGEQTYVIAYRVENAVRQYDDHDELYWDITGEGWRIPIQTALATVHSPHAAIQETACFTGVVGSDDGLCQVEGSVFSYEETIGYGDNFTIVVGFDANNQLHFPTAWERFWAWMRFNWSLLLVPLPLVVSAWYWWRNGRDEQFYSANIFNLDPSRPVRKRPLQFFVRSPFVYEPLQDLSPGEAGALLDEKVDTQDIVAEILELARKKFLKIEALEEKKLFGTSRDYQLTKLKGADSAAAEALPGVQRYLLQEFFKKEAKQVKVSELKGTFYKVMQKASQKLEEQLIAKTIFVQKPNTARTKAFLLFFALSVGVFVTVMLQLMAVAIFWPALLLALQIPLGMLFAYNMPQKTAVGTNLWLQAKGLRKSIGYGKWREKIKEKNVFIEEVLPFAVSLGVVKQLSKQMEELNLKPPAYVSTAGLSTWSTHSFVSSLSNEVGQSLSYNPSSSSASGSSGFSGGFSGGGGGGGGGGSW